IPASPRCGLHANRPGTPRGCPAIAKALRSGNVGGGLCGGREWLEVPSRSQPYSQRHSLPRNPRGLPGLGSRVGTGYVKFNSRLSANGFLSRRPRGPMEAVGCLSPASELDLADLLLLPVGLERDRVALNLLPRSAGPARHHHVDV